MDYTESLYTTGQFADLMKVNKRTLHYYNDIGIFKPAYIDDNGYHFYSPLQAIDFDLLLTYQKIGMSLEEIKSYKEHPSEESFHKVLKERKGVLEESIKRLTAEKALLDRKTLKLELAMKAEHGKIEEINLPEQPVLLSDNLNGKDWNGIFQDISKFATKLKSIYGVYDNFGSRISIENVKAGKWNSYDAFFAYVDEKKNCTETRDYGHYLRAYSVGSWENLAEVYGKMLDYAKDKNLEPVGYAYEEGLNEMSLERSDDYVTMILMKVE